jgi:hypothetical protein
MVVHTSNRSSQEAETRGSRVLGHSEQHTENPSQNELIN